MDDELAAWQSWINSTNGNTVDLRTAFMAGRDSVTVNADLLASCKKIMAWAIKDQQSVYDEDIPESEWGEKFTADVADARAAIAKAE